MSNHYEFFVDDSEISIAELGSGFLKNYIENRAITKGFIVVTQKRAYLKGKNFEFTPKGKARKTTQERIVELKDITGTGIRHTESTFLKVITIISAVRGCIGTIYSLLNGYSFGKIVLCLLIYLIEVGIFYLLYKKSKKDCFTISYGGGSFGVDTSWCSQTFVDNFHKELRKAIDSAKKTDVFQSSPVNVNVVPNIPQPANDNTVDKSSLLREYHKLLEDGIISNEEFEKMKADVIGK
jgi:hypothetical protein